MTLTVKQARSNQQMCCFFEYTFNAVAVNASKPLRPVRPPFLSDPPDTRNGAQRSGQASGLLPAKQIHMPRSQGVA
jgi:hypothetical protein